MFIAALLTIAKIWKQPKCPSTDEWIKKIWYTHTMECYSATKKNEIMSFVAPWDSPGKNIGVGCHFLLQILSPNNMIILQNFSHKT